ncbi:MAG: DNA-methyltransferase [bacterium]
MISPDTLHPLSGKSSHSLQGKLYIGDNLKVMRNFLCSESIDLIYLDPPFNSLNTYRIPTFEKTPFQEKSQPLFKDRWRWDDEREEEWVEIRRQEGSSRLSRLLETLLHHLGTNGMTAYLVMMAVRLREMWRVLKKTGSIYLHCDPVISAYLRLLMDGIFGEVNFLNNIVWCYGLGGSSRRYWPRKHDDILWYAKKRGEHYFQPLSVPAASQKMKGQMKKIPDYWYIPSINNMARERLGYPTQKPEALLERIILSSSREGDWILDPFSGSGTTLVVAQKWGRRWIGIDNNFSAIRIAEQRLAGNGWAKGVWDTIAV